VETVLLHSRFRPALTPEEVPFLRFAPAAQELFDDTRCGELDAGVDGSVVGIACDCGARMARRVDENDGNR
jgi:hypothetical protein